MYCRNCGNTVNENQEVCLKCGVRPLVGEKFCQNCGVEVSSVQEVCVKCGVRLRAKKVIKPTIPPKSPGLAAFLSLLIAGLGQIYLGQTLKGISMFIAGILLGSLTGLIALPVIYIVSIIDAYTIGKKLRSGQTVTEWEFF